MEHQEILETIKVIQKLNEYHQESIEVGATKKTCEIGARMVTNYLDRLAFWIAIDIKEGVSK